MRSAERRVVLGLYRARPTRQLLEAALDLGLAALDTAYNYQHFGGHRALAATAGELLGRFDISTKVGFFPDGHSLEPARLRAAVEKAGSELGRAPNTVLLHNPECSPQAFQRACETLAGMRNAGLCQAWGLSSWNPIPLLEVASRAEPDVLMVRAGLAVPPGTWTPPSNWRCGSRRSNCGGWLRSAATPRIRCGQCGHRPIPGIRTGCDPPRGCVRRRVRHPSSRSSGGGHQGRAPPRTASQRSRAQPRSRHGHKVQGADNPPP